MKFFNNKWSIYFIFSCLFAGSLVQAMEKPTIDLPKEVKSYPAYLGTEVYQSGGQLGNYLRATTALPQGCVVAKFEGPITDDINNRHAKWMGIDENGKDKWIIVESTAVYVNHSCDPNSTMQPDGTIVTTKEIASGEPLTISYNNAENFSPNLEWDKAWDFDCFCGTSKCPKRITSWKK